MLAEIGVSYEEIGRMTPDQVYHRMCNKDVLKAKRGVRVADARIAGLEADADGFVRGRAVARTVTGQIRHLRAAESCAR
jgi:hypothetical protein